MENLLTKNWRRYRPSWGEAVCLLGIALFTAIFFDLQLKLYNGFSMRITDLSMFDQALYNTLHGRFLVSTAPPLFTGRLHLIILAILPIYALFPHTYTLFFLQALMNGLGAWPVFLLARDKLRSEMAATCFAVAYLLYPALQGATLNQFTWGFRAQNFSAAFLLFAWYFLRKKRYGWFTAMLLLTLSLGENEALVAAGLGLYVALFDRERRKVGLATFAVSAAWIVLSVGVILPYINRGRVPYYVAQMSTGGGHPLLDKLARLPSLAAPLGTYLLQILTPVLFLSLASLPIFAISFPKIAINILALLVWQAHPAGYHSSHVAPIIPFVFISAIWGLDNLYRWVGRQRWPTRFVPAGAVALVIASAICTYWFGFLPFSRIGRAAPYAADTIKLAAVNEAATLIPPEAALCADNILGSHFTRRAILHRFPHHWRESDYVLVDASGEWTLKYDAWQHLQDSPDFRRIYSNQGVQLYERLRQPLPPMQHPLDANFGGQIRLLGYTLDGDTVRPGDTLRLILYWQALKPIEKSYTVFAHLLDGNGVIRGQEDSTPVNSSYPTDEWTPGETIVDRYYDLTVAPDAPPGPYTIEVGLYYQPTGIRLDVLDEMGNPQETRVFLPGVRVEGPR